MYVEKDFGVEVDNTCDLKFCKKRKKAPAFITEFTNGHVIADSMSQLKFESCKSIDDSDKINVAAKRCLHANNGRLNYMGTSTTQSLQYFVGVRDKSTGKMKLYDSTFFRMNRILNDSTKSNAKTIDPATPSDYWNRLNQLTEQFGSKVKKRAMHSMLKNNVDDSPLNDSLMVDNPVPETPVSAISALNIDYLPPQNRESQTVNDVFNIEDIISPEEDDALNKEAELLLNTSEEELNKKYSFCNYVNLHSDVGKVNFNKAKYLIYYNYLVQFQLAGYSELQKKNPMAHIPEPYKSKMLNTFSIHSKSQSGRSTRSFPKQMKDKLAAYILVLALFIDDFSVNTSMVVSDLKIVKLAAFINIAQALGCHVLTNTLTKGEQVKFAVLKLPLYAAPLKQRRKISFK